mmetsp:Transcript_13475/g.16963  ORF Transcript_13475/g.16963 Transcript_13475/m.16963 type:complete len:219 (+) Transcript_13475:92-748(+)
MIDVIQTVSNSPKPVIAMHFGTTPVCGDLGKMFGINACCSRNYVDPLLMNETFGEFQNVTFVLLHAGFDFLPPDDENYYNGTLVDASIAMASLHDNVYLEISALHSRNNDENRTLKYPGGDEAVQKIYDAGLARKVIWASDGNHNQGGMLMNLERGIESMIKAGFSDEERCSALTDLPRRVYGMELPAGDRSTGTSPIANLQLVVSLSICVIIALLAF